MPNSPYKRPELWCLWCGDDLPISKKTEGNFCSASCSREYHADLGGYEWVLDLLAVQNNKVETT